MSRFGQDDLLGVAERLEAMVGSMEVLKDMPEAEDRAATLRELQERLEALLQPKLLEVRIHWLISCRALTDPRHT